MDNPSLNHYEEQLYSVFKTFDVDNEEALNKAAVVALCDALQLEERGAALVDTLFERRTQRVTFAQFRSGLLAVLGAEPQPEPAPPPAAPPSGPDPPPHSDEDSSGREVAPKFVFGSKKYGRRSRPHRTLSAPEDGSRSVCSEGHIEHEERARRRSRAPRSASAAPPPGAELEHDSRIDCRGALALCRRLRMDNIDTQLVERIFEAEPAAETTVGEFFDKLNSSLSGTIGGTSGDMSAGDGDHASGGPGGDALPGELVADAWEAAGVQQPRRLLADLGFGGAAVRARELAAALEEELAAFGEPTDARALLLTAALALSRLRGRRARAGGDAARAERDRLRADLAEANRRAVVLAQEVDENHARLEAELTGSLRRAEARHADALRALEADRAAERDRAAADRAALETEVARRADNEAQLRSELQATLTRCAALEARTTAAEERSAAADKEASRLAGELRAARASPARADPGAAAARAALEQRLEQLQADNKALRDRCDELCAALEAPPPAPAAPTTAGPALAASWREEAAADDSPLSHHSVSEEGDCGVASAGAGPTHAHAQTDADADDAETERLNELVRDLEASLEAMRDEYERCEEYWAGKLSEERALAAAEARAGDARLAELARTIADYERQYRGRLPAIDETALEDQITELEQELAVTKRDHERLVKEKDDEIAGLRDRLNEIDNTHAQVQERPCPGCAWWSGALGAARARWGREAGALRARLGAAERAVGRLTRRLHQADLLVRDLYLETCRPPPLAQL